ncbi:MAG: exo-alpha-sialidase, partial [Nocardiopsaceae bacterium]|nr:exo-alpha-sialidase [Nocardiopsaceae bacterium]
ATPPAGTAEPAGGPVPAGFAATSVTFASAGQAFVLGTAPCARKPCTSIVRTLDRGASWRGMPAPVAALGQPGDSAPSVWGIRFASPWQGFVFGTGLWETADGGEHWARAASPPGDIVSLEIIDGQVLAVTEKCAQGRCARSATLMRRPLAGGAWRHVATLRNSGHTMVQAPIATQANVAAVLDGTSVLVTSDGGLSTATRATPCRTEGVSLATEVAVTGPDSLALLCTGQAGLGSVHKTIYVSDDLGAHWTQAGATPRSGDPFSVSGGTTSRLLVAAASGASELYYSGDGGQEWSTAYQADDGGDGWNDLGFTTPSDGVVVHGPALSDGNSEKRPGQLLLTTDGGATWHPVTW